MRLKLLPSFLVLALFATSALAAPQVRYRLTLISSPSLVGGLSATALNNRGEVVGTAGATDGPFPFVWRDGQFVDLKSRISAGAEYIELTGINDRSQIVGFYVDPDTNQFRGFLLDRRQVTNVQGPPTAEAVFLGPINDREQILGSFYDAEGNEGAFINDQGSVRTLDPSFAAIDINLSGVVSGTLFPERRAAIWEDGEIIPIAPAPSDGRDINDRGQVIGLLVGSGTRAFVWERGRLTVLPALLENQTRNLANDINNSGRIVGETAMNQLDHTLQLATVWDNGQVADLNTLIHPDDPLRPYVTLTTGTLINDRGEIVAQGTDSRVGYLQYYFLEPVHGH